MKITPAYFLWILLLFAGCKDNEVPLSGTVTIDNEIFGTSVYYAYGFSFSKAAKVSSNDTPDPDITVQAGVITGGVIIEPFLSANTFKPSFGLAGEYATASEAQAAFNALTDAGTPVWIDLAAPLKNNQVWVIRTGEEKYAKIRTIEVKLDDVELPPFASCKFQWVYQPDGSKTFPQ
ncbi:MAG: hypothetical protein L0Y37_07280 [Bacteroidales bacterium]|nr:hypothetical protein [Bacteroidales bacterium]